MNNSIRRATGILLLVYLCIFSVPVEYLSIAFAQDQIQQRTFTECSKGRFLSNGRNDWRQETCLAAPDEKCAAYEVDFSVPHGLNFQDQGATTTGWGVETGLDSADSLEGTCVVSSGVLTDSSWFGRKKSCRTYTQKIIGTCIRPCEDNLAGIPLDSVNTDGTALAWKKPDGAAVFDVRPSDPQFSYTTIIDGSPPGEYIFDMAVCLCTDSSQVEIEWERFASDDEATVALIRGGLTPIQILFTTPKANSWVTPQSTIITGIGTALVRVKVNQKNFGTTDPSGNGMHITPKGLIKLKGASLGPCGD